MRASVDDKPYIEYLAGRPVPKVSPKHRHAVVQLAIGNVFLRLGRERGTTGLEWRFRLAEGKRKTHLVPDLAFFSYARWRALPEEERQEPRAVPDAVVEIRSPSDRESNVQWKIREYLDGGTALVLDVLPEQRRIVAYAREGTREFGAGDVFEHPAMPWLRFEVEEVFALLEPTE